MATVTPTALPPRDTLPGTTSDAGCADDAPDAHGAPDTPAHTETHPHRTPSTLSLLPSTPSKSPSTSPIGGVTVPRKRAASADTDSATCTPGRKPRRLNLYEGTAEAAAARPQLRLTSEQNAVLDSAMSPEQYVTPSSFSLTRPFDLACLPVHMPRATDQTFYHLSLADCVPTPALPTFRGHPDILTLSSKVRQEHEEDCSGHSSGGLGQDYHSGRARKTVGSPWAQAHCLCLIHQERSAGGRPPLPAGLRPVNCRVSDSQFVGMECRNPRAHRKHRHPTPTYDPFCANNNLRRSSRDPDSDQDLQSRNLAIPSRGDKSTPRASRTEGGEEHLQDIRVVLPKEAISLGMVKPPHIWDSMVPCSALAPGSRLPKAGSECTAVSGSSQKHRAVLPELCKVRDPFSLR